MCKISSRLPIKKQEGREWDHSRVFTVDFKMISHIFVFEQVSASEVIP